MLKDIHKEKDQRNINISNVGICDYKVPITFGINDTCGCMAKISADVALGVNSRGAHLSRMIEVIDERLKFSIFDLPTLNDLSFEIANRCESSTANIEIEFEAVLNGIAPISRKNSTQCISIMAKSSFNNGNFEFVVAIKVIGAMVCPSSKEISKYGAHNQRCELKVSLIGEAKEIDVEKIVNILNNQFSTPVYSIVKREDEKYITEKGYENAKFSEDLIRDTLLNLKKEYGNYKIIAELVNFESIHQHNVFAKGEL